MCDAKSPAFTDLSVDPRRPQQQIACVHLSKAPEARGKTRNISSQGEGLRRSRSGARPCVSGRAVRDALLLLSLLSGLAASAAAPALANASDATEGPALRRLHPVGGARPAPPLALVQLDGRSVDGAGANGAVIVHFFATWCEPCRTELPALSRFAARHPHIPVLLVDVAEPEARLRRFLAETDVPGPVLLDRDRAAARAWGVSLLPASFVVTAGTIHLAAEGEVAWDAPENDALIQPLPVPSLREKILEEQ